MKKKSKKTDVNPESEALESNPEFSDQLEEMSEEFFETNDPEFAALQKRVKNTKAGQIEVDPTIRLTDGNEKLIKAIQLVQDAQKWLRAATHDYKDAKLHSVSEKAIQASVASLAKEIEFLEDLIEVFSTPTRK